MNEEELKSKIISDLLKIRRYESFEKNEPQKDYERYSKMQLPTLTILHRLRVKFLLDYRMMGNPYPSILEFLEVTNEKIIRCIENRRYEKW